MKPRYQTNLFYANIDPQNHEKLANAVQNELSNLQIFIERAIRGIKSNTFSINWKEDVRYNYRLFPRQRLRIEKPKNQIIVFISPKEYDENVPIQRSNFHLLKIESLKFEKNSVIVTLGDREVIREEEELLFKNKTIRWERISSSFIEKMSNIEDEEGNKYTIESIIDRKDHFELEMKNRIPFGTPIKISGISYNYSEITLPNLENNRLKDKEGFLEFIEIKSNLIQTFRPINGRLRIENGLTFNYELEMNPASINTSGKKIALFDPITNTCTADDEVQNRVDLFLDIISASKDKEIWENPRNPPDNKRIKVIRIFKEEGTLLLERLPSVDQIYPPNISYQLEVQKRAVENLMFYPSLLHRSLLRLFESRADATWGQLRTEFDLPDVKFEFLNTSKENTPRQQKFVLKALNTQDFAILEGPPGSGKTTAITELIFQLLRKNKKILLSSSTNVAVDNVLEKLIERYGDPEKLMNSGIVPLRIGTEEKVSRDIRPFQIDERKKRLVKAITKIDALWFDTLKQSNKDPDEILEDYLCYSSNLVCGTSIGIMKYPSIKRIRKQQLLIQPQFDYLIVDEASKTTFQEFLVPAIHAKRWIIAGDVRQLSPYTDILYAQINLEHVRIKPQERRALFVLMKLDFEVKKLRQRPHFIYEDDFPTIQAIYNILFEKFKEDESLEPEKKRFRGAKFVFFTPQLIDKEGQEIEGLTCLTHNDLYNNFERLSDLFRADVIFTSNLNRKFTQYLPENFLYFSPNEKEKHFMFRHLAWCRRRDWAPYEYRLPKGRFVSDVDLIYDEISTTLKKSWAAEVAWRLKRVHELQTVKSVGRKDPRRYYDASLRALLPAESNQIWRGIQRVAKIMFPSILTSLQTGVTQFFRSEVDKTVLSNGFKEDVLNDRHTLLEFQNRMHSEISKIPRKLFYSEINALNDTDDILNGTDRAWTFPGYNRQRMVWIDVPDSRVYKNQNQKEADEVFKQLASFLNWVKSEESRGIIKKYKVALLTFYERQRILFRDMMRKKYPEKDNTIRQTQFQVGNVNVFCYTIDKVQGREADVVFLSMVQNQRVGFMDCPNRLNVALTRAKYLQVIIGDRAFFISDKNTSWELTELAKQIYPPIPNISLRSGAQNYG